MPPFLLRKKEVEEVRGEEQWGDLKEEEQQQQQWPYTGGNR